MVLRCSLLGHDYGDAEVEREREERGSEVVVTVQEYEECTRCGERNVISENTEVTSLAAGTAADSPPDDPEPEPDEQPAAEAATDAAPIDAGAEAAATDDAALVDDDAATDSELIDAEDGTDHPAVDDDVEIPTDENGDPVTDDGEILEDDGPSRDRDRDRGEWPDSDDVGPPVGAENEPEAWPDEDEADLEEAPAAEPAEEVTDDAILLDDDDDGGETNAAADARSVTTDPSTAADRTEAGAAQAHDDGADDAGTGIQRAAAATAPGHGGGPREDAPTEFYCPNCDYVAASDRPSLRAGDICPECRKGYIGERELQ